MSTARETAMAETKDELPVLPEPSPMLIHVLDARVRGYTAKHMHAYATEAQAAAQSRINALLEEVEGLRVDAGRYRWLRLNVGEIATSGFGPKCFYGEIGNDEDASELDAAIDASLSAGRSGSGEASNG